MSRINIEPTTILTLDKLVALTKALKQNQPSKPIEFIKPLTEVTEVGASNPHPWDHWDNLMLLGKAWDQEKFDLILAWDDAGEAKAVFLGHWNDGVTE